MAELRSNVGHWQQLQCEGYFESHSFYRGDNPLGPDDAVSAINRFLALRSDMQVVVIGCGYGRETAGLAPRVGRVYGIDVDAGVLDRAVRFLGARGITNFVPVTCEDYRQAIPAGIDLVFSIVVMQHLTRDLVRDYFATLGAKLAPGGAFVVQFLEDLTEGAAERDADLRTYEPCVGWSVGQIVALADHAGLKLREIHTLPVSAHAVWHWAYLTTA